MSQATWNDVEAFVQAVRRDLAGKPCAGAYGIPRGGCVLAVMLSHALGVPYLAAPCKGCLVVDDISDTGKALAPFKGRYMTVTMHYKDGTATMPDMVFQRAEDWVVYPWEASA